MKCKSPINLDISSFFFFTKSSDQIIRFAPDPALIGLMLDYEPDPALVGLMQVQDENHNLYYPTATSYLIDWEGEWSWLAATLGRRLM